MNMTFVSLVILCRCFSFHSSTEELALYSEHKINEPCRRASSCVPNLIAESLVCLLSLREFEMLSGLVEIFSVVKNHDFCFTHLGFLYVRELILVWLRSGKKQLTISSAQVKWKLWEYWFLILWKISLVYKEISHP